MDDEDGNYYKPVLNIKSHKDIHKHYACRVDKGKKLSVKQYFLMIIPHIFDSINDHKDEIGEWSIPLDMWIRFSRSLEVTWMRGYPIKSSVGEIRPDSETNKIVTMLLKSFMNNYHEKKEMLRYEENLVFSHIVSFSYNIHKKCKHHK